MIGALIAGDQLALKREDTENQAIAICSPDKMASNLRAL
jgi:hypothetical protein